VQYYFSNKLIDIKAKIINAAVTFDDNCSYKTCYFSFVNKCKQHALVRQR